MLIEKVELHNFGPYKGDHEIAFAAGGAGVHLIRGDNGQGKTSLQRAILWCLYNEVLDRKGKPIRLASLLNSAARGEGSYQFSVKLHFQHEGKKWTVLRRITARSGSDSAIDKGTLTFSVVANGEPLSNAEHVIQRLLPREVSRFFFFDGEMLRDYEELLDQTTSSMEMLRNSIERVLGIPYLLIARDDLNEVQRRLENERSRLIRKLGGKDYQQVVEAFQKVSARIQEREEEIRKLQVQMNELEAELAEKKRRQSEIRAVSDLAQQRLKLDAEIKDLEKDHAHELETQQRLVSELYKTILVNTSEPIIARLEARHAKSMEKYNEKLKLTGKAEGLAKGLAAQKCQQCGHVLNAGKLRALQDELEEVKIKIKELTEVPEPNLEFEHHVNRLRHARSQRLEPQRFEEVEAKLHKLAHTRSVRQAKLKDLEEQLARVDHEEPRRLEVKIGSMKEELGRLRGRKETVEKNRLEDLEEKAELDQKLSTIDQKEIATLAERIAYAKSLAEFFQQAVDKYRDERRTQVESAASDIFLKLRSKGSFSKLKINQQFGLNIITKGGTVLDRAEWRSAGEEQVVALALIGALNQCAELDAPVFMDTPFGRLDTKHSKNILSFLPKLAKQVVLMVTDREFRAGDEHHLDGNIKTDMTIRYRDEKSGSHLFPTKSEASR
ncbi:DNA sulfur modification protein DndD [Archangium gephyra]|uniref:DNA double-strand break repair Rad50 ATPase n=1 Tax=Archangium gephyra TaxID=48 RepID=A0AAC8QDE0_9BACT|nr:AAA family ATPase [Archangium gephyra]AKJ05426.1 DNA double-strand break repair Rad50 ATPase [Archangium gephyra]REG36109.1 DNA sulfur modification protein DndD [Archangium gephyra]